jgi:L-amino acid N-acyltransferase YncA
LDLAEISAIFSEYAPPVPSIAKSPEQIALHFAKRIQEGHPFGFWVVVEHLNRIVGWSSMLPCRNHALIADRSAEVSVYVTRKDLGRGLGRLLLADMIQNAEKTNLEDLFAFIASEHHHSIKLFEDFGFNRLGSLDLCYKRANRPSAAIYVLPVKLP